MNNYTKINDEMVAKFGLTTAWVYAKVCYRMRLSHRNKNKYYHNGFFIKYKENELARDCHMSRTSVVKYLQILENAGYVHKEPTMIGNLIYLPMFKSSKSNVKSSNSESSKVKHPREQRVQNKDIKNDSIVHSSSVNRLKRSKSKSKFPSYEKIIKKYGKSLVCYAVGIYHTTSDCYRVSNPYHFIVGVLKRWNHKGIKTVNDAMISENDSRAIRKPNGPYIPIFTL